MSRPAVTAHAAGTAAACASASAAALSQWGCCCKVALDPAKTRTTRLVTSRGQCNSTARVQHMLHSSLSHSACLAPTAALDLAQKMLSTKERTAWKVSALRGHLTEYISTVTDTVTAQIMPDSAAGRLGPSGRAEYRGNL